MCICLNESYKKENAKDEIFGLSKTLIPSSAHFTGYRLGLKSIKPKNDMIRKNISIEVENHLVIFAINKYRGNDW